MPEILRGAGVWTSFPGTPVWTTAGVLVETAFVVIVASSLAAGAGLFGLARPDMPERRWLGLAVVVGTVLVSAGYWGHLGGPFAPLVHDFYNGPLAAFRNVAKFQPVITLPLVLGLINAVGVAARACRRLRRTRGSPLIAGLIVGAIAVVAVSAAPLPTGRVYPDGSFTALPASWQHAVTWLNARGGTSTTVVLPGTNFADFTWGRPLDQPIEALATVPWANRNIIPVGSVGNTQFLDAIDQVLTGGQPAPGLAAYLASAGVRYLLVENDLTPADTQSPPPAVIRQVLAQEQGIVRVANFGPLIHQVDTGAGAETLYDPTGVTRSIHALEVYRVGAATGHDDRVTTYPLSSGLVLSGGPQGVLAVANSGLLRGEAVSLAGDPLGPKFTRPVWVDADTQQRRNSQFSPYQNQSNLLAPGEPSPVTGDPSLPSGGPPNQWIVVAGDHHETTLQLDGASQITASSFGPVFYQAPGQQPLEAFLADAGRGGAAWEASPTDPRPWIEIRFHHSASLSKITLTPLVGDFWTAITKVQITTARGEVTQPLAQAARPQKLRTPEGASRWLRITLVGLRQPSGNAFAAPGLVHIAIPGVSVNQHWVVPDDGPTTPGIVPTYLFSSPQPNQFAVFKVSDDEAYMSRQFNVPRTAVFAVSGRATPFESPLVAAAQLSSDTSAERAKLRATFSAACGSGPTIRIDGRSYATSVHGTFGELDSLQPMALSLCGFGGAVRLGAGTHVVTADDVNSGFKVTSLQFAGTPPPLSPARGVTVTQWGNDDRALTAAAGQASIINVHENFNPGWVATVGKHQLRGVRLDGWQQGWVLPAADASEQVTLKFVPDSSFRAGLVAGAAIALALLAWVVLTIRRRKNGDGVRSAESRLDKSTSSQGMQFLAASGAQSRRSLHNVLWTGAIMVVVFVLAGPAAVVVPACVVLGLLARRRRGALAWLAGGAVVLAGVAIAVHPGYRIGVLVGSGSYTAQALGVLALAALAVSLIPAFDKTSEG